MTVPPLDRWDYDNHPGWCCPAVEGDAWTVHCHECAGTGVWPFPWIESPAEGLDRDDSSCVNCKGLGRQIVTFARPGSCHSTITRSARIRGLIASSPSYTLPCGKPTDRTHDRVTETPRTRNPPVTPSRTNNTRNYLLVEPVVLLPSARTRDAADRVGADR